MFFVGNENGNSRLHLRNNYSSIKKNADRRRSHAAYTRRAIRAINRTIYRITPFALRICSTRASMTESIFASMDF